MWSMKSSLHIANITHLNAAYHTLEGTKKPTSAPSILHENLFPRQNFKRTLLFFWKPSHAISGVWPEQDWPSEALICKVSYYYSFLFQCNCEWAKSHRSLSTHLKFRSFKSLKDCHLIGISAICPKSYISNWIWMSVFALRT